MTIAVPQASLAASPSNIAAACRSFRTPPLERLQICNADLAAATDAAVRAEILLLRGSARLDHGELALALTDFEDAARLDGAQAKAFNALGVAHFRLGEIDAAISSYDRAIELDGSYVAALFNRGNAWLAAGNPASAEEDFTAAAELRPEAGAAFAGRGRARYLQARYWDAYRDLARANELQDTDDYDRIWIYLALRRVGGDGRQWLASGSDDGDGNWPNLVLAMLRDEISVVQALGRLKAGAARGRPRGLAALAYFAGQRAELRQRPDEAVLQYQAALAAGCRNCLEAMAAGSALAGLQGPGEGAQGK